MANQLIIKIDLELKNKTTRLAKTEGKNLSEVIIGLLESYVKERDIESYIENLWERIGNKIKTKGYAENGIDSIIQEIRQNK